MWSSRVSIFFTVFVFSNCAYADQLSDLLDKHGCGGTAAMLNEKVRLNDASAQRNVALLYDRGICVDVDRTKAAHFYQLSSDQGDLVASRNLAILYGMGLGVARDCRKAIRLMAKIEDIVEREFSACTEASSNSQSAYIWTFSLVARTYLHQAKRGIARSTHLRGATARIELPEKRVDVRASKPRSDDWVDVVDRVMKATVNVVPYPENLGKLEIVEEFSFELSWQSLRHSQNW